jgi:hypothetical protein
MTEEEKRESNREFVQRWKRVGPMLKQIKRRELKAMRHEDQAKIIESLLEIAFQHGEPRYTSGLVELQKLLARAPK